MKKRKNIKYKLHSIQLVARIKNLDYGIFSLRLIGSAMFGATFNPVTQTTVMFGTLKDDSL